MQHWVDEARKKGLIVAERGANSTAIAPAGPVESPADMSPRIGKRDLLPSIFVPPGCFVVGVQTHSITNSRDMRASIGCKGHQRRAVAMLFGKHHRDLMEFADCWLHVGRPLRVTLTRLSPRQLDSDNLAAALKNIRDGVAEFLGVDDAAVLVEWHYWQEKSDRHGVRVQLAKVT